MTMDYDISKIEGRALTRGNHSSPDAGMCVMEAVSWIAGEPFSDAPKCIPSEIRSLAIRTNDADVWDSDAQRTEALAPLIPLMLRAVHDDEAQRKRGYLAAHYAAQRAADALDSAKLPDVAATLRAIAMPTSREDCIALRNAAQKARRAACAAAYAAYAACAAAAAAAAAAYAAADAAAAAYTAAAAAYTAAAYAAADAAAYAAADAADAARRPARRAALVELLRLFCLVEATP
jgi:hypothetical protein